VSGSTVFETADPELVHDMLVRTYRLRRLTVSGEMPFVRLAEHDLGALKLHRTTFSMRFSFDSVPVNAVTFGRVFSGAVTYRTGRTERINTSGSAHFISQPGTEVTASLEEVDGDLAMFDPSVFAELTGGPVTFTGEPTATPEAIKLWGNTYAYVVEHVVGRPAAREPLIVAGATRLLAATALHVFPNTASPEPTIEDRRDAHPATLRRAVAYIEEHAHLAIGPADVAAAAHVTVRALQLTFRRHLGTTPGSYLRRIRLECPRSRRAGDSRATAGSRPTTVRSTACRPRAPCVGGDRVPRRRRTGRARGRARRWR
jgi:hypothetical protein